jgi:hypothetical protein
MGQGELVARGRLGRHTGRRAQGLQEIDAWAKATGRERMAGTEIVVEGTRTEDEKRTGGRHRCDDSAVERIYTTPLLDKLGVKPGARVAIIGVDDIAFRAELAERTTDITDGEPLPDTGLVFLAADDHAPLAGLAMLAGRIVPNGAIWVVSRKGKAATIRDVDVIAVAKTSGLVDNKVVAFSPTHTALRLVIPVSLRVK